MSMSRITLEELSKTLKTYINNKLITTDQVKEMLDIVTGVIENSNCVDKVNDIHNNVNQNNSNLRNINSKEEMQEDKLTDYHSNLDNVEKNIGNLENLQTNNISNIISAINEIYNSSNTIRQQLVASLVSKGINVTNGNSISELINEVNNLGSGIVGNASGYTFTSTNGLTNGTMVNRGAGSFTPTSSNSTKPAGYYTSLSVPASSTIDRGNIVSGVSIFGVSGVSYEYEMDWSDHTSGTNNITIPSANISISSGDTVYVEDYNWYELADISFTCNGWNKVLNYTFKDNNASSSEPVIVHVMYIWRKTGIINRLGTYKQIKLTNKSVQSGYIEGDPSSDFYSVTIYICLHTTASSNVTHDFRYCLTKYDE